MTIRKRVAEQIRTMLKGNPTGSSMHVPAPMGEPTEEEKKKRRRKDVAKLFGATIDHAVFNEHEITKADSAQYIGRSVLNVDQLNAWWQSVRRDGEPASIDPNPHITVAFSRTVFDWAIDRTILAVTPDDTDDIGLLGAMNAVVLFLHSPILESRWQAALDAGATWSYDGYRPHLTLFYLGADVDVTTFRKLALPDFPIILGQELLARGGTDVFEAVKAPEWYQTARGVQKSEPVHLTVNVHQPAVNVAAAPAPNVQVTVEQPAVKRTGTVKRNAAGEATVEITEVPEPATK